MRLLGTQPDVGAAGVFSLAFTAIPGIFAGAGFLERILVFVILLLKSVLVALHCLKNGVGAL